MSAEKISKPSVSASSILDAIEELLKISSKLEADHETFSGSLELAAVIWLMDLEAILFNNKNIHLIRARKIGAKGLGTPQEARKTAESILQASVEHFSDQVSMILFITPPSTKKLPQINSLFQFYHNNLDYIARCTELERKEIEMRIACLKVDMLD